MERDHYEVLQLHPDADHAIVVQAYWHLARKYKAAMDRDAFAEHAFEELNRSFEVLGSPELRDKYDRERAVIRGRMGSERETKRVSIEVCFWHLPAWQGVVAATAAIALAIIGIASGTPPLPALCLAAVAAIAGLLVLPGRSFDGHRLSVRHRWQRSLRPVDFRRSTSRAVERWRAANAELENKSPAPLLDSTETYFPTR